MKDRLVASAVLLVCLVFFSVSALSQNVYDNGPINGTTDAWTINSGFEVSNSFRVCCHADGSGPADSAEITGVSFGAWLFPGDVLQTVEVSITSAEFGGTTYTDQTVSFSQSGCSGNQYGFNVCTETGTFGTSVNLAGGNTYWLNLSNAVVNDGDPVYWDENSGVGCGGDGETGSCPASASENSVGTIPSEAFTVLGTTSSGGSVPEPGSLLLFGSGVAALAGILRRRFTL